MQCKVPEEREWENECVTLCACDNAIQGHFHIVTAYINVQVSTKKKSRLQFVIYNFVITDWFLLNIQQAFECFLESKAC